MPETTEVRPTARGVISSALWESGVEGAEMLTRIISLALAEAGYVIVHITDLVTAVEGS